MEKITKIQQKLSDFEKFLSPELTEEEISIKLMETFDQSKILIKSGEYNPGSKFYRARIIDSPNMDSLKSWKKQDFWGVPKEKISSYGRLNKPKESVFYLSAEPLQTLKEIGLESYDDQRYAVISCFETKKVLLVSILETIVQTLLMKRKQLFLICILHSLEIIFLNQ
ncbi:hypothetical protein GQR36_12820 [Enterococcus termitis]